jgi:hypothetical protein
MAVPFFIESFAGYVPKLAQNFAAYSGPANIMGAGSNGTILPSASQGLLAEYISYGVFLGEMCIINGLGGSSAAALLMMANDSNTVMSIDHTMPANYSRVRFGFSFMTNLSVFSGGVCGLDGGTIQWGCGVDSLGRIIFTRGDLNGGTVLFTSAATILSNIRHYLVVDVTTHPSAGTIRIWLDGVDITSGGLTSQNTRATANSYVNRWRLQSRATTNGKMGFGDFFIQDNTAADATITSDRIVDGLPITTDDAVQFSPARSLVGNFHKMITSSTNAAGANQLVLVPVVPTVNMTINSISIMPRATSAGAKFKGVIYGDTAGVATTLLSSGTEAVGCTTGIELSLGLVTPQALTGGTTYWIGYICDTSVATQISDPNTTLGVRKANTYTSGAPSPAGGSFTTGQSTWSIWGLATGAGSNYDQINRLPPAMQSTLPVAYNQDGTVGHIDSFNVTDLPVTPTGVDMVQVKVLAQRTDAGARTVNIKAKSGATAGNGDNAGVTPPTSLQWLSSRFALNPATSAAWTPSEVNGMKAQIEIAS